MDDLLAELTEPFTSLPETEASGLLAEHWGIAEGQMERLDTERDDSFRAGGYVLKVAHPADTAEYVGLQVAALEHAGRAGLPVQRVVPATSGESVVEAGGRLARVLTWLPGELMASASLDLPQVAATGSALARLSDALRDFAHAGARRTFAWDLQSFGALRGLAHPAALDPVFELHAALDLGGLPHQVIHNDFHPGNLLVDARDSQWVVGILDFGDTLYAPRVQDLAVALAYLLPAEGDPLPVLAAFVEGYGTLTADEYDALPVLVAARLAQRIMLPPLLGVDDPAHRERLLRTLETLMRTL